MGETVGVVAEAGVGKKPNDFLIILVSNIHYFTDTTTLE